MSRESKIMTAGKDGAQQTISHYEAFGWELLSINGNQITMSRETQNPVYADLVKLQAKYEEKVAEYASLRTPAAPAAPAPISPKTCFFSFICLVFPCVIYVHYKVKERNQYRAQMEAYAASLEALEKKKKALCEEMNAIVLEGRTVFFSKQG